jgi:DNA-directed RNA polymerase subunit RPC12/RpoP
MTKKEKRQDYLLRKRYDITLLEYKKLLRKQKYKCAICGKPQSELKKRMDVDHSHKTNFIRGLLCPYCNRKLLAFLRDNKKRAKGLIKYLQRAIKEDTLWQ